MTCTTCKHCHHSIQTDTAYLMCYLRWLPVARDFKCEMFVRETGSGE